MTKYFSLENIFLFWHVKKIFNVFWKLIMHTTKKVTAVKGFLRQNVITHENVVIKTVIEMFYFIKKPCFVFEIFIFFVFRNF